MMKKVVPALSLGLCTVLAFTGCETSGQSTMAGAAAGAAIGGLLHGRGRDAFHGAAIGAGAGYLLGKLVQNERRYAYERGYDDARGYHREPRYPYGRFTDEPGIVRSPYRPYHLIDVRGIPPGALVIDSSCEKIFVNP